MTFLNYSSRGSSALSWPPQALAKHTAYIDTGRQNIHTHEIINKMFKREKKREEGRVFSNFKLFIY